MMRIKLSEEEKERIARELAGRCAAMTGKWLTSDVCGEAGQFLASSFIRGFREAGFVFKHQKKSRTGVYVYETVNIDGLMAICHGAPIPVPTPKGGCPTDDLGMHYDHAALSAALGLLPRTAGPIPDELRHRHTVCHNKEASTRPIDLPQSGTLMEISV